MTEREALLRAVYENPDDDTPRLVFADWLDENGEPERAEFIRLQCRRAREPGSRHSGPEFRDRVHREFALWAEFGSRWQAELPSTHGYELDWGDVFDRGFAREKLCIKSVPGSEQGMLDWDTILLAAPFTRLELTWVKSWMTLFERPGAVRLKTVALHECGVGLDSLKPLQDWGSRTAGHLVVEQAVIEPDCELRLRSSFADRLDITLITYD